MKVLLFVAGFVLFVSNAVTADKALADALKPYEQFSPYKWTQWIESRPGNPIAAAAIAYSAPPLLTPESDEPISNEIDEDDDDDDEEDDIEYGPNPFESWFKRAILPQPFPEKKSKDKKVKDNATKKPSIVDVSPDFWGPPPSIAPNVTGPPPPGYWAAKKSMFVSKLFAALAQSVLNTTGPPTDAATTTTTVSPRQAILDELSEVLLSDFTRSVKPESVTQEPEEYSEESDEDSSEELTTLAPKKSTKSKAKGTTVSTPRSEEIKPTTINPFLLTQVEFLAKLTEAIAASNKPTAATAPKPRVAKPASNVAPPKSTGKAADKKAAKKGSKKSAKKLAKTPAWQKYIPTTTTPSPASETPAVADSPEIDYAALARALLGSAPKNE